MNETFLKFKKRVWLFIIVKCAIAAFAATAFAVAAVFIPVRFTGVKLNWAVYIPIALGGFALGGGVAYLLLRTNDKKIALLLDSTLGLQERVQTAYRYQNNTDGIYELQRRQANSELSDRSVDLLPFGNIVITVLLCAVFAVCSVGIPVVAALTHDSYSAVTSTKEPEEPPRVITDWEWEALDELIEHVKNSGADSNAKSGILQELYSLKNILLDGVSGSALPLFVDNTVTAVRNAVKIANEQDGVTDVQKSINTDEQNYVIARLYEIFKMNDPNPDNPENPGGGEGGDDEGDSNVGLGGLAISGTPFYDPEKGTVKVGEVIEQYQGDAIDNENISDEMADLLIKYFGKINKGDD